MDRQETIMGLLLHDFYLCRKRALAVFPFAEVGLRIYCSPKQKWVKTYHIDVMTSENGCSHNSDSKKSSMRSPLVTKPRNEDECSRQGQIRNNRKITKMCDEKVIKQAIEIIRSLERDDDKFQHDAEELNRRLDILSAFFKSFTGFSPNDIVDILQKLKFPFSGFQLLEVVTDVKKNTCATSEDNSMTKANLFSLTEGQGLTFRRHLIQCYKTRCSEVGKNGHFKDFCVGSILDAAEQTRKLKELAKINPFKERIYGKSISVCKHVSITGPAGIGKTTFAQQLAVTWCHAHAQEKRVDISCDDAETLRRFDLLFYLNLRDFRSTGNCNLEDLISNFISRVSPDSQNSFDQIAKAALRDQFCLVILDGIDEWAHSKSCQKNQKRIPHENGTTNCTILASSRKPSVPFDKEILLHVLTSRGSKRLKQDLIKQLMFSQSPDKAKITFEEFERFLFHLRLVGALNRPYHFLNLFELWKSTISRDIRISEVYEFIIRSAIDSRLRRHDDSSSLNASQRFLSAYMVNATLQIQLKLGKVQLFALACPGKKCYKKLQDFLSSSEIDTALESGNLIQINEIKLAMEWPFCETAVRKFIAANYVSLCWSKEEEKQTILQAIFSVPEESQALTSILNILRSVDENSHNEISHDISSKNKKPNKREDIGCESGPGFIYTSNSFSFPPNMDLDLLDRDQFSVGPVEPVSGHNQELLYGQEKDREVKPASGSELKKMILDLKSELEELQKDLMSEIEELQKDLKSETEELQKQIRLLKEALQSQIDENRSKMSPVQETNRPSQQYTQTVSSAEKVNSPAKSSFKCDKCTVLPRTFGKDILEDGYALFNDTLLDDGSVDETSVKTLPNPNVCEAVTMENLKFSESSGPEGENTLEVFKVTDLHDQNVGSHVSFSSGYTACTLSETALGSTAYDLYEKPFHNDDRYSLKSSSYEDKQIDDSEFCGIKVGDTEPGNEREEVTCINNNYPSIEEDKRKSPIGKNELLDEKQDYYRFEIRCFNKDVKVQANTVSAGRAEFDRIKDSSKGRDRKDTEGETAIQSVTEALQKESVINRDTTLVEVKCKVEDETRKHSIEAEKVYKKRMPVTQNIIIVSNDEALMDVNMSSTDTQEMEIVENIECEPSGTVCAGNTEKQNLATVWETKTDKKRSKKISKQTRRRLKSESDMSKMNNYPKRELSYVDDHQGPKHPENTKTQNLETVWKTKTDKNRSKETTVKSSTKMMLGKGGSSTVRRQNSVKEIGKNGADRVVEQLKKISLQTRRRLKSESDISQMNKYPKGELSFVDGHRRSKHPGNTETQSLETVWETKTDKNRCKETTVKSSTKTTLHKSGSRTVRRQNSVKGIDQDGAENGFEEPKKISKQTRRRLKSESDISKMNNYPKGELSSHRGPVSGAPTKNCCYRGCAAGSSTKTIQIGTSACPMESDCCGKKLVSGEIQLEYDSGIGSGQIGLSDTELQRQHYKREVQGTDNHTCKSGIGSSQVCLSDTELQLNNHAYKPVVSSDFLYRCLPQQKLKDESKTDLHLGVSKSGELKTVCQQQVRKNIEKQCHQKVKGIVRELHVEHRDLTATFVLQSYFDRLNRGEVPSLHERMQYEWLRLASFQHYQGAGNALALARNGFYHDPADGPTSTRCYLCEAAYSDWQLFQNVEERHRQLSPNCPFHTNRNQVSVNNAITYEAVPLSSSPLDSARVGGASSRSSATTSGLGTSVPSAAASSSASGIDNDLSSSSATGNSTKEWQRSLAHGEATTDSIGRHVEVTAQQPEENDENRDRSLLALPNTRAFRVLGRSGEDAYAHLTTPPRRNNVAVGAGTNAGLDPLQTSVATSIPTSIVSSTTSTTIHNSIFGFPIGAGAFGRSAASTQITSSTTATTSIASTLTPQSSVVPTVQTSTAPTSTIAGASSILRPSDPPIGGGGRTDPTITVVVDNPKHPDYRNIDDRVNSFQGWPEYLDQTPRQMSEAGFFFVGVADFTRCFCCGGGLRNWEPGDDPMLEHTRWFPRCEYVNKLKGERYVAAVQRRHQEHMEQQQREQVEAAQRRDANRNPPDPMSTETAAVLREMGYQPERIREAILTVRQRTGSSDVTTQQVLTYLLDENEDRRPPPTTARQSPTDLGVKINELNLPSTTTAIETMPTTTVVNTTSVSTESSTVSAGTNFTSAVSLPKATKAEIQTSASTTSASSEASNKLTGSSSKEGKGNEQTGSSGKEAKGSSYAEKQSAASGGESDGEYQSAEESLTTETKSSKKKTKKKGKTKLGSKSGATGGPNIDTRTLKEENEKLREMQTCKICMERPVNTTLLPCGHLVCCDICASRLNRCPICRKRIKGTVKTFMS